MRASADYEVFRAAEEDESVIGRIVAAQREELEREIGGLKTESRAVGGGNGGAGGRCGVLKRLKNRVIAWAAFG